MHVLHSLRYFIVFLSLASLFSLACAYSIFVENTSEIGTIIFEPSFGHINKEERDYSININRSAAFIKKLFYVDSLTGTVILKYPLNCDGLDYPNTFTFYIDSVSNGSFEYISLPLKVLITGCDHTLPDFDLAAATLASYDLPGTSDLNSRDQSWQTCFRKSQLVITLTEYLVPYSLLSVCHVRYVDVNDPLLKIEQAGGQLVASQDFCVPLDPPWKISVVASFQCESSDDVKLLSAFDHEIRIALWRRKQQYEVGRVRRDTQTGGIDNKAPQFEKPLYLASVTEEQAPGIAVCTVHAKSVDGGEVSYQMVPLLDGRSHTMFTIDQKSGVVTSSLSLDRELLDVHYFRVQAVDLSNRPYSSTTTLQVNVLDINDHAPEFEATNNEYEASVRESVPIGSIVTTVRATDKDVGRNGDIEYNVKSVDASGLSNNAIEIFSMDPSSGVLTTRSLLDREASEVYTIVITAADQALPVTDRKTSSATIIVKVVDENDNYPQFSERAYSVTLPEDTNANSNPIVASTKASDLDQGQNAAVRYAIIGGNTQGQFSIDSQTGDVSLLKPLDYETTKNYRLVIRVQDGGNPTRSNTTQLLVNVQDVNDNAPRFYTSQFQESVLENVPAGFNIVKVQAYDADEKENGEIKYSIAERDQSGTSTGDMPITVDENTGWIHTTRSLDREVNSRYQFQVLARDGGDSPKYATANVAITIQDVNDNDPLFSPKNYEAVVSEDDAPGTPVTGVVATDPDENPRLHYEIMSGNVRGRFAITTQNGRGLITIAQPLDYKLEKRFILSVKASDSGNRFDTATVYINVTDANNFAPSFENTPYTANVFEDVPIGTTVLIVLASDGDVGQNAQITYALTGGSAGETSDFTVNPQTGAIITTKQLDRETQSGYLLTITAKDGGVPSLSDTTDVEISITDVNDNAPVFQKSSYSGSVSEDSLVGTSVLQLTATDMDSGLNGRIRYALEEGQETFVVDPTSGVIRTAAVLDRESVAQYQINALAIDRGNPSLTGTVAVTIKIGDINDSPPTFPSDKLVYYVPENSPVGTVVCELFAKDPDEGENAVVQYSIIGGEDANSFSLVRRHGSEKADLLTLIELDYESNKKVFYLVVRATSPPLRTDVHIEVFVTDVNDNAPQLKDFQVIFNNYKDCFPSGPFGRMPATDADVSDKLKYRIISGNNANLVKLNEATGFLTLSPQLNTNVQKNALLDVSVSDGVNDVKASMQLIVRLVTEEMLFNSVTVRLNEMTKEAFLSPLLTYFVEGLAAIIPCPKENVYVFSIMDDTDVDRQILNVSFSARRADSTFYPTQYLRERVYLNRIVLAKLSTAQILPFDDNLCVREPCLNFEQCHSILKFGNASEFISSDSVLFRPIYPVSTFACQCPEGFSGGKEHYLCDIEVNLCYSNPCLNGGTCRRKEGGYNCFCSERFGGERCEIDLDLEKCLPGVACEKGATCSALSQGGYGCDNCFTGEGRTREERVCQLRTRSFSRGSFLTFPSIKERNRLHLSLKFATTQESGLLLYNGRYNELHDFIALEITDGGQSVRFSYSLGAENTRVSASLLEGVNDGKWHTVEVSYYNMSATISLDGCDARLAIKYGAELDLLCANSTSHVLEARCLLLTETCHRFLDLTGPLQIGGLPSFAATGQINVKSFAGCISDVYVNYKLLDLNGFVADNGTTVGCPELASQCSSSPCKNGGNCTDSWANFQCDCADGWGDIDCSQSIGAPWQFNGDGILLFNPLLRPIQLPWLTSFVLRTLQKDAIIMSAQIGLNSSASVALESGYVVYTLDGQMAVLPTGKVNDGKWHRVEITWLTGTTIYMSLDYGKRTVTRTLNAKIQGLYVGKISLGNYEDENVSNKNAPAFVGCLKDVRVGSSQSWLQRATIARKVVDGCSEWNPCDESKCPKNSECVAMWRAFSCVCEKGYVGPSCQRVCDANPCENGGKCVEDLKERRGYRCECDKALYTGEYCETEIERTCPVSWWGHPVCGPCNCDQKMGYNPVCNKTNGECSCKENHYRANSNRCVPCDCYTVGSYDTSCNKDNGQCKCRSGVVGKHCNACPNLYAEVTLRGCEVVYDGCPRNYADGIWWPRSKFGEMAVEPCGSGEQGNATRLCDANLGNWQQPNVFNCTSEAFSELKRTLAEMDDSIKLNTYTSVTSAVQLRKAVNTSLPLHGSDILIAEKMIRQLLTYEEKQAGLNLTHSQDKDYIQNIVLGISRVLTAKESSKWNEIDKMVRDSPELLMHTIWNYLVRLATNQHDTYTDPFEVVTSNFALGLDIVSSDGLYGYESNGVLSDIPLNFMRRTAEKVILPDNSMILESTGNNGPLSGGSEILGFRSTPTTTIIFPKYNNYLPDKSKFDPYSHVMIPIELLGIKEIKQGESAVKYELRSTDNAVVGYAQYLDLGSLLPARYDETVMKRWGVELTVGSAIMSVVAVVNHHLDDSVYQSSEDMVTSNLVDVIPLPSPIRLRMWLNYPSASVKSNPQCVRWTNHRGLGEWTRAGCLTETFEYEVEESHPILVNCTCNQFSTFAILVDVVKDNRVVRYPFVENVLSWISFGLAIVILCVACLLLILVRPNTNSSSIYVNHTFCLLLTQCLFLFALKSQINIISNEFMCRVSAMSLHYLWLTTLSWSLVGALHLYRMLTEMRDVNHGQMGFYHSLGYGLPAIVVGLSVGVRAEQYGNYFFCWLSLYESVVWSLVGPVCMLVTGNLIVLLLSLKAAFTLKDHVAGYGNLRTLLWISVISLPLLVGVWMLELIAATEYNTVLVYALSLAVVAQAWFVLCGFCFGNARLRISINQMVMRITGQKSPDDMNSPTRTMQTPASPPRSSLSYRNAGVSTFNANRRHNGISSSTSSSPYRMDNNMRNTSTSTSNYDPISDMPSFQPIHHTSDSDSEASVEKRSIELASSHSSDDDESSTRSRRKRSGRANRGLSRPPPGYLPNIVEDCSPSRIPSVQPPKHLNVIANSQLFPNTDDYTPEDSYIKRSHNRWTNSSASDDPLTWDEAHASLAISSPDGECEPQATLSNDKYTFPYTAEEDHCPSSPYLSHLRANDQIRYVGHSDYGRVECESPSQATYARNSSRNSLRQHYDDMTIPSRARLHSIESSATPALYASRRNSDADLVNTPSMSRRPIYSPDVSNIDDSIVESEKDTETRV